ncbi:hypothetical protein [Ignavibacterium album]|nr:hypothetical protein [Ignavibacterium album]
MTKIMIFRKISLQWNEYIFEWLNDLIVETCHGKSLQIITVLTAV